MSQKWICIYIVLNKSINRILSSALVYIEKIHGCTLIKYIIIRIPQVVCKILQLLCVKNSKSLKEFLWPEAK